MFSEAPVKTSLFKKWIDRLEPFVSEHSYSIIDMSKDKIELNNQEDLTSILFMAGAKLPFLPKMMCGGTVSAELMDELNLAIWQPVTTKKGISQRALKNQKTIPETHLVK